MASEANVSTPALDATVDVDADGLPIGTMSDLGLSLDSPAALALLPDNMLLFGFRSVQQGIECIDDHHGWGLAPTALVGSKWYPYGYSHPKVSCARQATAGRPTIIVRVEPIEHALHKDVTLLPCWGCLLSSPADCTVKGAVVRAGGAVYQSRGPRRPRPPRVLASRPPLASSTPLAQTSSILDIRTPGASTPASELDEAGTAKRLKRLHNTSPSESAAYAGEYTLLRVCEPREDTSWDAPAPIAGSSSPQLAAAQTLQPEEPSRLESPQPQRIAFDISAHANGSSKLHASSVLNFRETFERFVASVHDMLPTMDQALSNPQNLRDQLAMDRAQLRSDLSDLEDKLVLRDFELQALRDSNSTLQDSCTALTDSCTALTQRVVEAERSKRTSARAVERWERVMLELVPDHLLGGSTKWRPEEVAEIIRSTLRPQQ